MSKPIRAITDLNPRQLKFLEEYVRNGNMTKAYMLAFGLTNRASAAVLGSRLLKKTGEVTRGLYEQADLGMNTVIQILKDAIKAEKNRVIYKKDGSKIVTAGPDHILRLKAIELIYKFSGWEADMKRSKVKNQLNVQNVQIISDEKRGIFRVQDAQ